MKAEYIITIDGEPDIMGNYPIKKKQELVRCKDCKHLFNAEHNDNCCDVLMEKTEWSVEITVDPDWFCADGEGR